MQGIAWNDPKVANHKTQAQWETILGTTQANGTYIGNIVTQIKSATHWDDSDYAGPYAIHSISSWTTAQYRSLFVNQFRELSSPVQLHPVLNSTTSTYYPGSTSGHFDVGIGFDYSVGDWVNLYEPAGGPAQNNIYPAKTAWEDTTHIRLAQLANTNQNIAY